MATTGNRTNTTENPAKTPTGPAPKASTRDGAQAGETASAAKVSQKANLPKVRITYVKSVIGYNHKQRDTIKSLGFHRLNQTVEHTATPEIRGMINRVSHLVRVEEVGA